MILHIVNRSPFEHHALEQCLGCASPTDSILLIEDATLLLANPQKHLPEGFNNPLYVLEPDCAARGLTAAPDVANGIDYDGFVDLVARHDKTMSWF